MPTPRRADGPLLQNTALRPPGDRRIISGGPGLDADGGAVRPQSLGFRSDEKLARPRVQAGSEARPICCRSCAYTGRARICGTPAAVEEQNESARLLTSARGSAVGSDAARAGRVRDDSRRVGWRRGGVAGADARRRRRVAPCSAGARTETGDRRCTAHAQGKQCAEGSAGVPSRLTVRPSPPSL